MKYMKYLSLFTGIGGFELGIQKAYESLTSGPNVRNRNKNIQKDFSNIKKRTGGVTCVGYSEIDKYAIQIYQKHYPEHKNYGDITKINPKDLPDFDILMGGFPCQAFSIAGRRKGFADTRGTLFFDIARIIKVKKPTRLLLENVKGLLSHDDGRTFATILATLDGLGYDLQWQVLNSKNFGVPQNRERVYIVGHLRKTPRPEVFPLTREAITTDKATFLDESQWRREGKLRKYDGHLVSKTVRVSGRGSPHGSKQNWDTYQIGATIRRLTPVECERLQSFPDGWTDGVSDTQRYKCLGNAVTVNVIKDIMERMIKD